MQTTPRRGFTLIELLVVVAIIVILLAVLIPGLQKAIAAAERSQCGSNQRSIAQASAAYALEFERTFPTITAVQGPTVARTALEVRMNGTGTDRSNPKFAMGFGKLIVSGRVGGTSEGGGKVAHCPSLDTTSALPLNIGMDLNTNTSHSGGGAASGASFWSARPDFITSGYLYRGKSYWMTHSKGDIRTNVAKQTFGITSDLVTYVGGAAANNKSGRMFHHVTGWNVSFGDGHVSFIEDPEGPFNKGTTDAWPGVGSTAWTGKVERDIAQAKDIHGGTGTDPAVAAQAANATATEDVFKWFGTGGGG